MTYFQPRRPTVTVVIPTLNEAQNLPLVLPYIPLDLVNEVIIVDGRSSDETITVACDLMPTARIVLQSVPGKGAALRAGYLAATGDIVIGMDADGSHDPREIPRFVRALLEGADFVKGSRFAPHGGTTDMPRYRKLGNGGFVHLVNLLFNGTFTDITYGFHGFWRYCLGLIEYRDIDDFSFEIALYVRALAGRLRVIEVPSFEGYRFTGIGKLQTLPDGWRILRAILKEWLMRCSTKSHPDHIGFHGVARSGLEIMFAGLGANQWSTNPALSNWHLRATQGLPSLDAARTALQVFFDNSSILREEQSMQDDVAWILRLIVDSVGAASGTIVLFGENKAVVGGSQFYGGQTHHLAVSQWNDVMKIGLAGWVAENRLPVLVPNTREDPRWLRQPWDENNHTTRSALLIPLLNQDEIAGVITLVRAYDCQFTTEDLQRVTCLIPAQSSCVP